MLARHGTPALAHKMKHQFGWDLPPGVWARDIEDAQGDDMDRIVSDYIRDGAIGCRNCGDTWERPVDNKGTVAACEDCGDPSYSLYAGSGWLLEKMLEGQIWYVTVNQVLTWTDDVNKALRLARREDADMLAEIIDDCERIAEHEWVDQPDYR